MNRRYFLKLSGAGAGLVLIPTSNLTIAQEPTLLTEDDPQASALGYVEQSPNPANRCVNCAQAKGDLAAERFGCNLFPGRDVKATGWCKVWSPRPS